MFASPSAALALVDTMRGALAARDSVHVDEDGEWIVIRRGRFGRRRSQRIARAAVENIDLLAADARLSAVRLRLREGRHIDIRLGPPGHRGDCLALAEHLGAFIGRPLHFVQTSHTAR